MKLMTEVLLLAGSLGRWYLAEGVQSRNMACAISVSPLLQKSTQKQYSESHSKRPPREPRRSPPALARV